VVIASRIDIDGLVEDGRVNSRVYSDPQVFEMEMEKIFHRTWVYVGHETEIPDGGDYKSTYIGRRPVIVSRHSDDGQVYVFFNRCRHRGATVCQQEYGNSNYFRCAYHGWVYNNKGDLVGVTFEDGYGSDFDKEKLGLVRVPRVGIYQGFIFASLSPEGPSLDEHLGNAKPYIDKFATMGPEGISVKAGTQKFAYNGNWKMQLENTVDGYHPSFVHQSYQEIVARRSGGQPRASADNRTAATRDLGNGHALLDFGDIYAPPAGNTLSNLMAGPGGNLVVFPNLALLFSQIRHIRPLAVNRTVVNLYPVHLKGVPAEVNTRRLREHEDFYGPASFAAPDDWEIFTRCQAGYQAAGLDNDGDWVQLKRGLHHEKESDDGVRYSSILDESSQRGIYRQYRRLMTAD